MIRKMVDRYFDEETKYVEMFGLSTDEKPVTGLITGSKFTEVDTGDVYLFNEEGESGNEWTVVQYGANYNGGNEPK